MIGVLAPCFSQHTTQPRIGGGGRGPYKFSTLSGKEGTEGKLGWASETKVSNVVIATTAVIALMWEGMEQLNKLEVARIQDKAQAEVARVQDKAQAEVERNKLEVTRVQDKAQAEVARVQDKARLYEYLVQIVATKDYEPLKAILNEREWKEGAAAATWHESGGVDEKGEAGSLSHP